MAWGAALAMVWLATACASVDVPDSLSGPTTTEPEASGNDPAVECSNPTASLAPEGTAGPDVAAGTYMAEIQRRGHLRVGVDVATYRLGSVNPATNEFEGFDIEIAREVADALLPDVPEDERVVFVGIPSASRVDALTGSGPVQVDMVASAFTINCERREQIAFSSEYFHAGQRVLVRTDSEVAAPELQSSSAAEVIGRLGEMEATVCVSEGSTAIGNIEDLGPSQAPTIAPAPQRADCLVRLQQGDADAMVTDDAILVGMAAQDATLTIVPTNGSALSDEPYGLGLPPGRDEWVRYVNAVLEDVRASGRWDQHYQEWLGDELGPMTPPEPVYGG
jgi:polar amino acid transport system substrate-binding protein